MSRSATALALAAWAVLPGPAAAQALDGGGPEFGTDESGWARDGECDDPRFAGPGMAPGPLIEADLLADATDCRAAYEAGTIDLAPGSADAAAPPVKGGADPAGASAEAPAGPPASAPVDFGNDSSEWAQDGECDDRRFAGQGMAATLTWQHAGRDATDCRALADAGAVRAWAWAEAVAATDCPAIDFGDDAGEFARDGICDDPRFEGPAMAPGVAATHRGHDADDCRRLCELGAVALRDY